MSSKKPPSQLALNKRLIKAAEEGKTSAIVESIELGADLECKKTGVKRTPLIICCKNNDLENAKVLVKHGADINTSDEDRKTCLTYAVENANDDMICFLLDQPKIDTNTVDGRMYSPLALLFDNHKISFARKCKLVPCFLEKGAHLVVKYTVQGLNVVVLNDINDTPGTRFSRNALMDAVVFFQNEPDYKKMIKMMIKNSSSVSLHNAINAQKYTSSNPLVEMMKYEGARNTSKPTLKQFEISEMMIKKGADINARFVIYKHKERYSFDEPLFMKFCKDPKTPVSVIDYIIHHKDFKSTDKDIATLEESTGDMCKVFQLNHEMMKSGNPMTVEANRDLIEFTLGNMPRSKSRSSSSKSSSSRSSSSRSSKSKSSKKSSSSKGGSSTRKRR